MNIPDDSSNPITLKEFHFGKDSEASAAFKAILLMPPLTLTNYQQHHASFYQSLNTLKNAESKAIATWQRVQSSFSNPQLLSEAKDILQEHRALVKKVLIFGIGTFLLLLLPSPITLPLLIYYNFKAMKLRSQLIELSQRGPLDITDLFSDNFWDKLSRMSIKANLKRQSVNSLFGM